jgi:hypothetical protein
MAKIGWDKLPARVREHVIERMHDRAISVADLNRLRLWIEMSPEVPEGDWYNDFGSLKRHGLQGSNLTKDRHRDRDLYVPRRTSVRFSWYTHPRCAGHECPRLLALGPYRVFFFSNEGLEPPHVHVQREESLAKFWLQSIALASATGFSVRELRHLDQLAKKNQESWLEAWHEFFGSTGPPESP